MKVIYKCPTLKDYIAERRQIMKDLCIWQKLSDAEKSSLYSCTTEVQVDNLMAKFRRQYL